MGLSTDILDKMFGGWYKNQPSYEERLVENTKIKGYTIDTTLASDIGKPYETAIKHEDGKWVIVEDYYTKEQAQKGHTKWVRKVMKQGFSVKKLRDIYLEK